ncbi:hypothetical protein [Hymenobacter terricola]|uniref:hypothetical protein n=1 Tax=Hymenobacter terricola TaxID=2819236 RepID=UPI001B304444|nr:hypothetical protein [Hymenobacter terricola]
MNPEMLIPEIKLIMSPDIEELRAAVRCNWNEVAGIRNKLGGEPVSENVEMPLCTMCSQ